MPSCCTSYTLRAIHWPQGHGGKESTLNAGVDQAADLARSEFRPARLHGAGQELATLMFWARLICRLFHIDVDHDKRIVWAGPGGRQHRLGAPWSASGGVQRFVAQGLV